MAYIIPYSVRFLSTQCSHIKWVLSEHSKLPRVFYQCRTIFIRFTSLNIIMTIIIIYFRYKNIRVRIDPIRIIVFTCSLLYLSLPRIARSAVIEIIIGCVPWWPSSISGITKSFLFILPHTLLRPAAVGPRKKYYNILLNFSNAFVSAVHV